MERKLILTTRACTQWHSVALYNDGTGHVIKPSHVEGIGPSCKWKWDSGLKSVMMCFPHYDNEFRVAGDPKVNVMYLEYLNTLITGKT